MPAQESLYQGVLEQISGVTREQGVRITSVRRLALLVTGIIAAQSAVLHQVAAELLALGLTQANTPESITRRLRRTLSDSQLDADCYRPVLGKVIDFQEVIEKDGWVVLALDESSKEDEVHLLRVSLSYHGSSLPLAWTVWAQNEPLDGQYWTKLDMVLEEVATVLPEGLRVIVTADRAFDVPSFIDRIAARGWHWIVRVKTNSSLRFLDTSGTEHELRELVREHLPRAGHNWQTSGYLFKDAGWRLANVMGVWEPGQSESLVVISDLSCEWPLVELYDRRYWIEPGFRNDKSKGWKWEDSQVKDLARQERLLLGMAWATLVVLCMGVQTAQQRLAARLRRKSRITKPEHARESLFTLGLRHARQRLYLTVHGTLPWHLPDLAAPTWTSQWQLAQLLSAA